MKTDSIHGKSSAGDFESSCNSTAVKMLKENLDIKFISSVTGMSLDEIIKLKNKTQIAS